MIEAARLVRAEASAKDETTAESDTEDVEAESGPRETGGAGVVAMPLLPSSAPPQPHREKVARPVSPNEVKRIPEAGKSVKDEWDKLRKLRALEKMQSLWI